ncbi:MAG TPA: hypothetical protein VM619_14670 [Luteimonas sp.]|nr:hypothetical protein [Luteimonas sp.]
MKRSHAPHLDLFVLAWCAFFAGMRVADGEWGYAGAMLALGLVVYCLILAGFQKQVRRQAEEQMKEVARAFYFLAEHMRAVAARTATGEKP